MFIDTNILVNARILEAPQHDVARRGETLLLRRRETETIRRPSLDEVWPVHSAGGWPQDLSLDRAEIYEGRT